MIVHTFHEPPDPELAFSSFSLRPLPASLAFEDSGSSADRGLRSGLAAFEQQFTYPLGPDRSFRIEHGADYARFYRAIGEARCFVAEDAGRVLGVLSLALRPLLLPDGRECATAYLGDLKVLPEARRSTALFRLARAAEGWVRPQAAAAFGVVMDGTPVTPSRYTGRAGIPSFVPVARLTVLRFSAALSLRPLPASVAFEDSGSSAGRALPSGAGLSPEQEGLDATEEDCRTCFRALSAGRFACPVGDPAERSSIAPQWLVNPDGSACGCLEDTRKAKRLLAGGEEMVSAHLSNFAWRDVRAGAALLQAALRRAAQKFPALFVAVPARDAEALASAVGSIEVVRAPATVYAHGVPAGGEEVDWIVNSSEI